MGFGKAKFKARFEQGKKWEKVVFDRLVEAGIPAEMECDGWIEGANVHDMTVNDKDIVIPTDDGLVVLEVKSRRGKTVFTGPDDFPFDTCIVDTKYGFDKKAVKPNYYISICQHTSGIIVIPVSSKVDWMESPIYDSYEGKRNTCYVAPKHSFRDFDWLVEELNGGVLKQGDQEEGASSEVHAREQESATGVQGRGEVLDFPERKENKGADL